MNWRLLITATLCGAMIWFTERSLENAYDRGYAAGMAVLEQTKREQAELDAASAKATANLLIESQQRTDQLAANLAEQQRKNRATTDQLNEEIDRVTTLYRRALDAAPEPVPGCIFNREWVRIYDTATGAILPANTGRVAASSSDTAAAGQLDSGISQSDVLRHHTRYAEQCRDTADQLNALIDACQGR